MIPVFGCAWHLQLHAVFLCVLVRCCARGEVQDVAHDVCAHACMRCLPDVHLSAASLQCLVTYKQARLAATATVVHGSVCAMPLSREWNIGSPQMHLAMAPMGPRNPCIVTPIVFSAHQLQALGSQDV